MEWRGRVAPCMSGRNEGAGGLSPPTDVEAWPGSPCARTGPLTLILCGYFKGRVPAEPFLETYLKRQNPR
eukprot:2418387-Prymnesium_polylepis.1